MFDSYQQAKAIAAIKREALQVPQPSAVVGRSLGRPVYIKVKFSEKDKVKALGAKWDSLARLWFVPAGRDLGKFEHWIQH